LSSYLYEIPIEAALRPSTVIIFLPPVEKHGLSILNVKSRLSKNGFLNGIGFDFPPPNSNGPLGYGNVLVP